MRDCGARRGGDGEGGAAAGPRPRRAQTRASSRQGEAFGSWYGRWPNPAGFLPRVFLGMLAVPGGIQSSLITCLNALS